MALAGKEADDLGSSSVTPPHLLLGIIRQGTGVAALVLRDLGVDLVMLRDDLLAAVTGDSNGDEVGRLRLERDEAPLAGWHRGRRCRRRPWPARTMPVWPPLAGPACPRCERPLADHLRGE